MNEDIIEINDTRDPFILLIAKLDYFVWIKRIISVFKERLRDYVAVSSKIFSLCASILLKKEKKKRIIFLTRREIQQDFHSLHTNLPIITNAKIPSSSLKNKFKKKIDSRFLSWID